MMKINGLTLLSAYADDNSDDGAEEGSKTISDSLLGLKPADQIITSTSGSGKRKRSLTEDEERLPLPSALKHMFESQNANTDDPSAHGGKVRTFAHVRGNWTSFVYIPFSESETMHRIRKALHHSIRELTTTDNSNSIISININEEMHLSLTKTQVFRHHWIEPFINSLKHALKAYKPFDVTFNSFEVYVNEERTRTFLGIQIYPSNDLLKLIEDFDNCLSEYELEPYYEEPSFHVSVAWVVGDHENWMRKEVVPSIMLKWPALCDMDPALRTHTVKCIMFKTGNKQFELFL